jgi:hypothetical protein
VNSRRSLRNKKGLTEAQYSPRTAPSPISSLIYPVAVYSPTSHWHCVSPTLPFPSSGFSLCSRVTWCRATVNGWAHTERWALVATHMMLVVHDPQISVLVNRTLIVRGSLFSSSAGSKWGARHAAGKRQIRYLALWRLSLSEECFIRLAGDEPGAGGLKRPDSNPVILSDLSTSPSGSEADRVGNFLVVSESPLIALHHGPQCPHASSLLGTSLTVVTDQMLRLI